MKTLRITAALLLTLAAACSASPTGPTMDASAVASQSDGGGFFGGGTREQP